MGYNLSEKIKRLSPYEPITGDYKIRLDANESFLGLDDGLRNKIAVKITAADFSRYPDPYASAVCGLFADYIGVKPENLVAGNGSDEIISIIMSSFFCKDDKVLMFSPDFSMYKFYAYLSELEAVVINKDENMRIDIDVAINTINNENIRGVIFSNPCSPTSIGITAEKAVRLAEKTSALVIIDEAYMEFYNESAIQKINELQNLIILKTCSKAMGLAGIRLGFAVSNRGIINAVKAAKSPYNVNTLTQCAAEIILSDKGKINSCIEQIIKSRNALYESVKQLEGGIIERVYPTCTNFVFIKTPSAEKIFGHMKENGIAIRLMGGYLRVTAGSAAENAAFIDVLTKGDYL